MDSSDEMSSESESMCADDDWGREPSSGTAQSSSTQASDCSFDDVVLEAPIFPGARISVEDSVNLIGAFAIRVNLSDSDISLLLKLLNAHGPCDYLPSLNIFMKNFQLKKSEKHFVCTDVKCLSLVVNDNNKLVCRVCNQNYDRKSLISKISFFSYLPVKEQIQNILAQSSVREAIAQHKSNLSSNTVVNSRQYTELVKNRFLGEHDITLQLNSDGVACTKSSKLSLWPVQLVINELPLSLRHKHVILPLVWLSKLKPIMNEMLTPLMDELYEISKNGIQTIIGNVKAHVLLVPVDSQARAMMMNVHHHNGHMPCTWCLIPGEMIKKGNGHARIFLNDVTHDCRTRDLVLRDARIAVQTGTIVNGIKGPSVLSMLPTFNIVSGFTVEYLHNICLGVFDAVLDIMTSAKFKDEIFSIRTHLSDIDNTFLAVTPTSEISRLPEKISNHGSMKASLKRSLLCYFFLPLMHDIIPKEILDYLLLLVYAVRMYLKASLSIEEENRASACIDKFCKTAHLVLNRNVCTFNLHILRHVPEICRAWGSLYDSSTFPFEGHNGVIMKLTHGTVYQTDQILRNHQLYNRVINQKYHSETVQTMVKNLFLHKKPLKNAERISSVTVYDKAKIEKLSESDVNKIEILLCDRIADDKAEIHLRFHFQGILTTCSDYSRLKRRVNCFFKTVSHTYPLEKLMTR